MTEKVTINNQELAVVASVTSVVDDDIKASAPVRVYVCQPGGSEFEYTGHWGVAAVILDPSNNGLFISIVSLETKEVILKQEVYDPFTFSFPTSNFQTFEADEFTVGLCFAEGYDAKYFYMTVQGMINYVKHSAKQASTPAPAKPTPTTTSTPKKPEPAKEQPAQKKFSFGGLFKKKEEPVKSRPVIGKPKNFQHVSHIGFNSKEGFSEIPPQWKEIFRKAGISEEELKDKKTAKFLMKTIVHENAAATGNLPPPPTGGPPPPPPSMGGGPPPPPPPPPPMGGGAPSKIPTSIPQSEPSSGGGGAPRGPPQEDRGGVGSSVDLLEQIRQGTKLKKVTIEDIPDVEKMDEHEADSLANNIARAMEARRKVVVESESDDDDDDWEL